MSLIHRWLTELFEVNSIFKSHRIPLTAKHVASAVLLKNLLSRLKIHNKKKEEEEGIGILFFIVNDAHQIYFGEKFKH